MQFQYLESLDSVRAADGTADGDLRHGLTTLQAFLEILMALALGREVVVPQSYAFDSGAFLLAAERVLNARAKAAPESTDRPFRPHLFGDGIRTFDQAIGAMVTRVHDEQRPFVSSLYPDLARLDRRAVDELAGDLDQFFPRVAGDTFARPLELVREEFRTTAPVRARPRPDGVRLDRALADLLDPGSAVSAQAADMDDAERDVLERLKAAVAALDPHQPAAFGQRSRLRSAAPWPGRRDGLSARQVVGADLDLVVEFVDTLYNRAVSDSIGVATAVFSTSLHLGPDLDTARGLAQDIALGRGPGPADADGGPPLFDVELRAGDVAGNAELAREVAAILDRGSAALVPLLQARGDGGAGARDNDFWRSVDRLDRAAAGGAGKGFRKARDAHVELVAGLLRGRPAGGVTAKESVQMVLGGAGAAVPTLVATGPGVLSTSLTAIGAMAPIAAHEVTTRLSGRRNRRRLASALGALVQPAART